MEFSKLKNKYREDKNEPRQQGTKFNVKCSVSYMQMKYKCSYGLCYNFFLLLLLLMLYNNKLIKARKSSP